MKVPINKLSLYLIKEEYTDHVAILKDHASLKSKNIPGVGTFYYGESHSYQPSWVDKFFSGRLNRLNIFSASAKAIFLIEVEVVKGKNRIFAIPFGYGWNMLNAGTWEERFGLITTLNIIESDGLRKIDKKNLSSVPKDTSEQLSRAGIVADFGIDIEQDLIRSITGATKREGFGRTVTGKDSFSVSTSVDIANVVEFLKKCYERFNSSDYKKEFGWIDQISEIKNPKLIVELDTKLTDNIKNDNFEKTWMAVPEVLSWEDVSGFKYTDKKNEELVDDIRLPDFLASLNEDLRKDLTVGVIKGKHIRCMSASSDQVSHQWKAYDCLYCEVVDDKKKKTYLLSNGRWYEIEKDFAEQTNKAYKEFRDFGSSIALPDYGHKDENAYNLTTAKQDTSLCCMDRKIIIHGGGYSRIEFCDLLTKDKKIVHVKRYGGSSVLSHLFAQGVVSGELFLADREFRDKVNALLVKSHKLADTTAKPRADEYEVIFAIISGSDKVLDIPFFSKVSLRYAVRRLQTYGYKVSLLKVSVAKPKDNDKE
jgi:uncharacterized protein (TIGR04141 family)